MDRLTRRTETTYIELNCKGCPFYNSRNCISYNCLEIVKNRLAVCEDAEEQGMLVRLPCKVGDTVYYIDGGKIYKAKASVFRINKSGVRVYCERRFMGHVGFDGIYGKTVFLTREEAEAALKEEHDANNS